MQNHIGSIAKRGTYVDGSHQFHSYSDTCLNAHDIKYDGELTPEVCERIKTAWNRSKYANPRHPSQAALRWDGGSKAVDVDVDSRKLLVEHVTMICD